MTLNYKLKVSREESISVQEECFKNGISWGYKNDKALSFLDSPYLYINDNRLMYGESGDTFLKANEIEVTPKEMLKILQGTK